MTKTKHTIGAALIAAAFTSGALAGSSTSPIGPDISLASKSDLTGSLETSLVSNYTYHGRVLDSNPVVVPKLSLAYPLFTGGSLQLSTEQIVGTSGSALYRSKYNVGLALSLSRLTVTPGYEVKAYPGRDGTNSQGVTGRVTLNDEGFLPVTLNPYVYVSRAVDPKGGTYYETGILPTKNLGKLSVGVPISVGAGSSSYYTKTNKDLKYAFTGVGLSLVYKVTDQFALKASSTYYNTDTTLANASNSFVQNSVGVAVSF